jgi:hypothetical protein
MGAIPLQLDPPLYVETPLGKGLAIIYMDDLTDIYWTVIILETRAIVQFRNQKIRAAKTYTLGLGIDDEEMKERTKL